MNGLKTSTKIWIFFCAFCMVWISAEFKWSWHQQLSVSVLILALSYYLTEMIREDNE